MKSGYMLKRLLLLAQLNIVSSLSFLGRKEGEEKKRQITVGLGMRRGHEHFCSLRIIMTPNQ